MIAVGIEVSQEKLAVFFSHAPKKDPELFPNTKQGIEDLMGKLPKEVFVLFDSEEPYAEMLYEALRDKGIECFLDHPDKVVKASWILVKSACKARFQ